MPDEQKKSCDKKRRYATRRAAKNARRGVSRDHGHHVEAFYCAKHNCWHLGRNMQAITALKILKGYY